MGLLEPIMLLCREGLDEFLHYLTMFFNDQKPKILPRLSNLSVRANIFIVPKSIG